MAAGDRPAYLSGARALTYRELLEQSSRMGGLLRELGVAARGARAARARRHLHVPGRVPRRDPDRRCAGPGERARASTRTSATSSRTPAREVVICEPQLLAVLGAALAGPGVALLARGAATARHDRSGRSAGGPTRMSSTPALAEPGDMAFWLYTSGSTGRPKGVVHLHRGSRRRARASAAHVLALGPQDLVFSSTKLYHSYGLGNSLSYPLYFGASAVLLDGPPAPERLLATLRAVRPSVYCSVPALYRQLLDDPDADGAFDSVRTVHLGRRAAAATDLRAAGATLRPGDPGRDRRDGDVRAFCSNAPGDVAPGTTGRRGAGLRSATARRSR